MSTSAHPRSEPQPLPAFAAVMATALILSVAMAGGPVPGLGSVGAVSAALRSAGSSTMSSRPASAPATESGIELGPDRAPSIRFMGMCELERYLVAATSGPGRGDLPPPTA